ncbi:MAG: hypothetical protein ABR512_16020 [Desulfopila sp.]
MPRRNVVIASKAYPSSLRAKRGNPENIDKIIARVQEEPVDEKQSRNISIYCCRQHSGAKLKEIGKHFGIRDAAVSQASRRLVLKCEKDQELKKVITRLETKLKNVGS